MKGLNATRCAKPTRCAGFAAISSIFAARDEEELLEPGKVLSSMCAFDLSLTSLFKLIRKRLR
ncbi:hypothetical protein [Bradyrhizobium cenepequi]|uniref:hypothetical protein n=1 Tax=Bradyrhizobium cenepequi TaxID=2821403 RepID=UPI001CE27845|nr:hypothetical protein [Bradyrhizobium cenepequi]MCA6111058.1 hypothetical protein [Bradyrhizobium cenepequi]